MKQIKLLKEEPKAYGGELLKTRKGRSRGRPLDTKQSMHMVLRSSLAIGPWSFRRHHKKIDLIVKKFSNKYGVKILSLANVGNHLHFHLQLTSRHTYKPFIRAITAAIAMAVTGASRWQPLARRFKLATQNKPSMKNENRKKIKFWDYRPFTRVVIGFRALLNLKDYIRINQIEGSGEFRHVAEYIVKNRLIRSG